MKLRYFSIIVIFTAMIAGCVTTGVSTATPSMISTFWGYTTAKAPQPVYRGKSSQRFEVRPGDCGSNNDWNDCKTDRERAEVTSEKFYIGSDNWISFLIYLPSDFTTSPTVNTTLGQVHMTSGFQRSRGGFTAYPPLLELDAKGDDYTACFVRFFEEDGSAANRCDNRKLISKISDMRGRWSRITIHFSAKSRNPSVEIFFDSKLVASFQQMFPYDPQDYYLKYGIYRSFVSKHRGPMPTQIVYYDEVKVGKTQDEVENDDEIID